jgi:uncharacterized protein
MNFRLTDQCRSMSFDVVGRLFSKAKPDQQFIQCRQCRSEFSKFLDLARRYHLKIASLPQFYLNLFYHAEKRFDFTVDLELKSRPNFFGCCDTTIGSMPWGLLLGVLHGCLVISVSCMLAAFPMCEAKETAQKLQKYTSLPPVSDEKLNDIETRGKWGATRLMLAAFEGDVARAKQLIAYGANVNAFDSDKISPLLYALGRIKPLKEVPSEKVLFNPIYGHRIHLSPGQKQIARMLIDAGANANAMDDTGHTPLSLASLSDDTAVVRDLLKSGAQVNLYVTADHHTKHDTALMNAALVGNDKVVSLLIDAGADVNARRVGRSPYETALTCALHNGQVASAKILISHGANVHFVDEDGYTTPMIAATSPRGAELVDVLLEVGASARGQTKTGDSLISLSSRWASVNTIKKLLTMGATYDPNGETGKHALSGAIVGKNEELVRFFLRQGTDVNSEVSHESLLKKSAEANAQRIVHILLEAGARPDDSGSGANPEPLNDSYSPLLIAVERRNLKIVRDLLAHGADPNKGTKVTDLKPIMQAVVGRRPNIEIIKTLLNAGANPNVREIQTGRTTLDRAKEWKTTIGDQLVELLLAHGAE